MLKQLTGSHMFRKLKERSYSQVAIWRLKIKNKIARDENYIILDEKYTE
jgi:hypothetical protein